MGEPGAPAPCWGGGGWSLTLAPQTFKFLELVAKSHLRAQRAERRVEVFTGGWPGEAGGTAKVSIGIHSSLAAGRGGRGGHTLRRACPLRAAARGFTHTSLGAHFLLPERCDAVRRPCCLRREAHVLRLGSPAQGRLRPALLEWRRGAGAIQERLHPPLPGSCRGEEPLERPLRSYSLLSFRASTCLWSPPLCHVRPGLPPQLTTARGNWLREGCQLARVTQQVRYGAGA